MAKYEKKFIVINRKHIGIVEAALGENSNVVKNLEHSIEEFFETLRGISSKGADNKYYVCNQDEPYAKKVIKTILEGERVKEIMKSGKHLK